MQRYTKLNNYYVLDNYTGQKLTMTDTINRLNQYERLLQEIRRNEIEADTIIRGEWLKMNLLNQQLKAIQTSKAYLQKELNNTTDEHQKQKIEHQLHCLSQEEQKTLDQLNFRLDDIILTEDEEE